MTEVFVPLAAALAAGLLGSAHCLGMCSGVSGLIAVNANVRAIGTQLPLAIAYNTGRILSYAILGMLVAIAGSASVAAIPALADPVRLVGGTVIVLIGLQIAFGWRLLSPLETLGASLWERTAPLARNFVPATTIPRAMSLGLLWGLLPCGLVYSVLLVAATSATGVQGAMIMLAFGVGTMPAMVATGIGAFRLSRTTQRRGARLLAGLLIALLGTLIVLAPLSALFGANPHSGHQSPASVAILRSSISSMPAE